MALPCSFFSFTDTSGNFSFLVPEFLSDYIFERFGIRKSIMLIVFQQLADLDTSKIWFYKYCENIWVTGIQADVNCFLSVRICGMPDINLMLKFKFLLLLMELWA